MSATRKPGTAAILIVVMLQFGFGQSRVENSQVVLRSDGVVSGRISLDGSTVSGVRVFLVPVDVRSIEGISVEGVSDKDGNFKIERVPLGVFTLVPEPGPYILPRSGPGHSPGASVIIRESDHVVKVDIELKRGAVIAGRVRDSEGQGVIGKRVSIQRVTERGDKRVVSSGNQLPETDDRGMYRIYGLEAGKYILSVSTKPVLPGVSHSRIETPTTYFPGVTEETRAVPIEVEPGGQFLNADFEIAQHVETRSAAGQVINTETGQPLSGLTVNYTSIDNVSANMNWHAGSTTDGKGQFRLTNIKPGRYLALVRPSDNNLYGEGVPFEVTTEDVTGLEIKLSRGSTIIGNSYLVEDGADKTALAKLSSISISAFDMNGSINPALRLVAKSTISPDASFRLMGIRPGTVRLMINSPAPQEFALVRTEVNGTDSGGGIEVRSGESITGVRLVLAYGRGNIVGQIKTPTGELPGDAQIRITARMLDSAPPRLSFSEADRRGHFALLNLPPGEYELKVIMRVPQLGPRQFVSAKQLVTIRNGRSTDAVVVLEPNK